MKKCGKCFKLTKTKIIFMLVFLSLFLLAQWELLFSPEGLVKIFWSLITWITYAPVMYCVNWLHSVFPFLWQEYQCVSLEPLAEDALEGISGFRGGFAMPNTLVSSFFVLVYAYLLSVFLTFIQPKFRRGKKKAPKKARPKKAAPPASAA